MKKLIAIVLGLSLLSIAPANAQEPLTKGPGKLYPQYILFDTPLENMVLNYPTNGVLLNSIGLTILNNNKDISNVYFGLGEPCSTNFHGDFKKESFLLGVGPTTKKVSLSFLTQNYGFNCPELILNISITFNGQSLANATTQRILIKTQFYTKTLEEQVKDRIEADRIAAEAKAKAEAEAKAKAEAEAQANAGWIQNHINEIQKITDAWNAAAKALEEQKRLEAEAKAKAEAEARERQIKINNQNYTIDLYSGIRCSKRGKYMIVSEITFKCVKKGKKLIWKVQ